MRFFNILLVLILGLYLTNDLPLHSGLVYALPCLSHQVCVEITVQVSVCTCSYGALTSYR